MGRHKTTGCISRSAVRNIDFALISLNAIFYDTGYDAAIYHNKNLFYFFHMQSILDACASVSDIFFYYLRKRGRYSKDRSIERSLELQDAFGINPKDYPLITSKECRNTNTHFAERYDSYVKGIGDYNVITENTDAKIRDEIMSTPHLRTLDLMTYTYYSYNSRYKKIEYDLKEVNRQLIKLRDLIKENDLYKGTGSYNDSFDIEESVSFR